MTNKEEYRICRERRHMKSGQSVNDHDARWDVCKYCGVWFRYVTELKEKNLPK